ncbi:MAG TPA: FkbM family methyltransferase [Phycisphaerae bacterium]|nr:FkbM family methyltransferase [Phycisphaerae bacterium]
MSFYKELGRALVKLKISKYFRIRKKNFSLRFYPTAQSLVLWVDALQKKNHYQSDETFFEMYLRPEDTVIDVGANVGLYTLLAASVVGPKGHVYSIEPHPTIFSYLTENIKLNHFTNIQPFNVAIGEKNGNTCFTDKKHDDINAVSDSETGIHVKLCTLDDIIQTGDTVNLLKIDVEGYEKFVLTGAPRILSQTDCIFIESYESNFARFNCSTQEIIAILKQHNFFIFSYEGQTLREISEDYVSQSCENFIAVKDINKFLERTGMQIVSH